MTGGTSNKILLLSIVALVLASCLRDVYFADTVTFPGNTWQADNTPSFVVPVSDTTMLLDVTFNIRTSSSYPFRNIFLFVSTLSPSGHARTDTIEYYLADETGRWYGKGAGDVHELILPYRSHIFFPEKGSYIVRITQGMRMEDLEGVYNFGLRLKKSDGKSLKGGKE